MKRIELKEFIRIEQQATKLDITNIYILQKK